MVKKLLLLLFIVFAIKTNAQTVVDIDGNSYKTVVIGTQTWMAENLRTTKFNNGTPITLVPITPTPTLIWTNLLTPAYCWLNDSASKYKATYGGLYNWYCVNTGKLCPTGWHVPSKVEWDKLISYLGNNAANILKTTTGWHEVNGCPPSPTNNATNESGFSALPAGDRYVGYQNYGGWCSFWSSTIYSTNIDYATYYGLGYYNTVPVISSNFRTVGGFSIRCVK